MALLKIARMGHPILNRIALPVDDPGSEDMRRLIADMAETMADADGIGLAAPQVYRSLRLILFLDVEERHFIALLRLGSAAQALSMMQEAFGAYRAVVSECSEPVRNAAWEEVARVLENFETEDGFVGKAEVLIAAGRKSAPAGVQ